MRKRQDPLFFETIISVILVTKNDEDIIQKTIIDVDKILGKYKSNYEILVVDNNSKDETLLEITKIYKKVPNIRVMVLSKEYRKEIAITAGLDSCIGDYVILFDQYMDPPEVINSLLEKLYGNFDVVIGKTKNSLEQNGFLSRQFLKLIHLFSSHGFDYSANFTLGLNRRAVNFITRTRRKNRNFSYINYLIGLKKCFVEYTPLKHLKHKIKKEHFLTTLLSVSDIILSNSFKPIRIIAITGTIASTLFVLYVFFIVILVVFFNQKNLAPQGWISIATVMGTLFFLLFSLLMVISEYVIRIFNESRDEPLYFVSEELDKSTLLSKKKKLNVI